MAYLVNLFLLFTFVLSNSVSAYFDARSFNCGPYGFVCEGRGKLRLCEGSNLFGPAFICPANTICNEDSSDVCENVINYIEPSISRNIKCRRNERIADPNVPDCKGYILCVPNKNRLQAIKFKCSENTIFNGYTRTCTTPSKYKCPLVNVTRQPELFGDENRRKDGSYIPYEDSNQSLHHTRTIDCKNYKFTVTQDKSPVKAAYFCPSRPARGDSDTKCTIFSNQFCVTLSRDDEDQFAQNNGAAYRRPRLNILNESTLRNKYLSI